MPPGLFVNPGTTCNAGGLLNSTTICSNNFAPDIIEKIALDPGWGHYEALGLQRWFADQLGCSQRAPTPAAAVPKAGPRKQSLVGASAATFFCPYGRNVWICRAVCSYGQGIGR